MKNYRVIYIIEEITNEGELITRRFARNKRIAMKIANNCKKAEPLIRKVQKKEHCWINPDDVEG